MMDDKRLLPARPDLAAIHLKGRVEAAEFREGVMKRISVAFTPLRRTSAPDGPQETQLLFGEDFCVYEDKNGFSWGQATADSYVGYVASETLGDAQPAITHRVTVLRSYVYAAASIKVEPLMLLSLNSRLTVTAMEGAFARLATGGFIRADHIASCDAHEADFVSVAEKFLHTPYHWGGRTSLGLDCSGLVATALAACGLKPPRDADQQEAALGRAVAIDPERLRRGDLVFWKGHVGIMKDAETLLHATGHSMLVVEEKLTDVAERIKAQGHGAITAVKRLQDRDA